MDDDAAAPEVSPLAPPADEASGATHAGLRGHLSAALRARWPRLVLTALVLLAAMAGLIGEIGPDALLRASTTLFSPARTAPRVPTATGGLGRLPTPGPATGVLAPPPTDCPASPPLDSITAQPESFSGPVTMYGRSPVWVPEGYMLSGTRYVDELGGAPVPYPSLKVIWEVSPTTASVNVQATDLHTGALAWWSTNAALPEATGLGFVPAGPGAGLAFSEFRSLLILTHAGCYRLDVTWQGGEWSSIFAAGARTSS